MEIQEVKTLADFNALRPEWDELFVKAGASNPFLAWDWAWNWWSHFKAERELNIVVAREGKELIAIAPMMRERTPLGGKISFLGSGLADYLGFLTSGKEREVIKTICQYLMRAGAAKLELADIPEASTMCLVLAEIYAEIGDFRVKKTSCASPFLMIETTWEEYWDKINNSVKKDVKWSQNKLKRDYQELKISVIDKYDERVIDAIAALSAKAQVFKVGKGLFRDENTANFIRTILKSFLSSGRAKLYLLEADQRLISYIIGFSLKNKYYYWNTAFDPEFAGYSPGKLLTRAALENAFRSGYTEFDFMKGEERYKLFWTKKTRNNYIYSFYNRPLFYYYEMLAAATYDLVKRAKNIPGLKGLWLKASKKIR